MTQLSDTLSHVRKSDVGDCCLVALNRIEDNLGYMAAAPKCVVLNARSPRNKASAV